MRIIPRLRTAIKFIILLHVLSACSIIGGAQAINTPTPVPTSSIPGMQVISPQACQIAGQGMIQVDRLQGDLVAWSPTANTIVYIAPTNESTWNLGELDLMFAPTFENPKKLVSQAVGEINWSPDGRTIAYLSLRRSDNLYTIGLVNPDGGNSRDLFPNEAARTDDYASEKAILNWLDFGRLRVLTSCGVDCLQTMDFGVLTGLSKLVGDPIQRGWDLWAVTNNLAETVPISLADLTGQLNWSPDGKSVAFIDDNSSLWIINAEAGTQYPLDMGFYEIPQETDWSFDGQYLSVRADQYLRIYSFDCP